MLQIHHKSFVGRARWVAYSAPHTPADLKGPLCGEGTEGRKERVGGKGRKGGRRQRLSHNKNPGYGLSNLV